MFPKKEISLAPNGPKLFDLVKANLKLKNTLKTTEIIIDNIKSTFGSKENFYGNDTKEEKKINLLWKYLRIG